MQQAKWFRNATMMAFFALIALFVSPVFAMSCCCASPALLPHETVGHAHSTFTLGANTKATSGQANPDSCCMGEIQEQPSASVHSVSTHPLSAQSHGERCAMLRSACDCDHSLDGPALLASNSTSFYFSPVIAALPTQSLVIFYIEDVRQAAYMIHAARPRSPGHTPAAGRAPPVLAQS